MIKSKVLYLSRNSDVIDTEILLFSNCTVRACGRAGGINKMGELFFLSRKRKNGFLIISALL